MREVRSALSRALSHQVFFAMFYPYPSDVESASEPMSDLLRVYEEVWKQVLNHYRDLRSALAPGQRKHIMLYAPVERTNTNFLVPPSNTRYTLVTESIGEAEYRSTLYSWVEAENVDGLYRVGTFSIQQAAPQITAWQAYFGKVLVHWKRCLTLPAGDEYWKAVRVAEAK